MKPHRHTGLDSPKIKTSDIRTVDNTDYLTDDDAMHISEAESVGGVKTFTSIPILPATDPTADNEMVRKSYVDNINVKSTLSATDILIDSADTEGSISYAQVSYTKVKQITINETDGTIRVKFDLKDGNGAGGCFGRIYVNDVAVGTEREETSGVWTTFSEDISANTDDKIQLKVRYDDSGGGNGGSYRNFRLYYSKTLDIISGTVNLD